MKRPVMIYQDQKIAELMEANARLRARVAELEAERAWRPIAEAPRDGREVIVFRPLAHETKDPAITIAATQEYPRISPQGVRHYTNRMCHPTHFMPLPPPPAPEGGQ